MKTQRLRAQVERLQEVVAELARAMGVNTDPDDVPDDFIDSLPVETKRAWLAALSRWDEVHGDRTLPVAERLAVDVPFGELTFDPPELKDQIAEALKRWQAGERPLPCGLRELATATPAAPVRPSPNGQAEPERRPKLDLP